ncbi:MULTISPECIES: ABC transporter permease subunit [unclassified Hahella]|uniref:ABC transporter permease subunit n=1 Tax=unclassified Hahella TaxID=2624107 RepID=UPI000FDD5D7E|nr:MULTISPECIES: ABC transporter permease subunit [unclassified Hahella]AZZ92549.1 ABC transporter permease subunit [Hahella sp. KA22]MBU6955060.1 ABC transporter permease subunit [Hahella sp. HN01]MDG9669425.1 ABC transporter permease subunit [Hahella sp. CR1]QAY55922.1 ABC transporter permease subunit [Hahella sp. KA22]
MLTTRKLDPQWFSDQVTAPVEAVAGRSLWQDAWMRFRKNRAAMASVYVLLFIVVCIVIGPHVAPFSHDEIDWNVVADPYELGKPSLETGHYFGTDDLGQDLFARTMQGGRLSIMVGFMGALVAVVIGTVWGAISGYVGGLVDSVMMRVIEVLDSVPFMFMVILFVTLFGNNIYLIFIVIGMVSWLNIARVVRGVTFSIKRREFIEAAHSIGVSKLTIVRRHVLPNVLGIVMVYSSLMVPGFIMFESFLSFLGLGVQPPDTSWGILIAEGAKTIDVALWLLMFPSLFLVATLFCFNFIGDGLRDALDPKDR